MRDFTGNPPAAKGTNRSQAQPRTAASSGPRGNHTMIIVDHDGTKRAKTLDSTTGRWIPTAVPDGFEEPRS